MRWFRQALREMETANKKLEKAKDIAFEQSVPGDYDIILMDVHKHYLLKIEKNNRLSKL